MRYNNLPLRSPLGHELGVEWQSTPLGHEQRDLVLVAEKLGVEWQRKIKILQNLELRNIRKFTAENAEYAENKLKHYRILNSGTHKYHDKQKTSINIELANLLNINYMF